MRIQRLTFAGLLGLGAMLSGIPQGLAETPPSGQQADPEQLLRDWEAKLEGSEWTIQLTPAAGGGKPQTDTLTLARGTVSSKWLSKEGFAASNYTLSAQDAASAEWQTTQSNPDGHVASWRISLSGDRISGALNRRTPEGQATVWYVNGTKVAGAAPAPAVPTTASSQPAPSAAPSTPPALQQQPTPQASQPPAATPEPQPQKKWGWW